MELLCCLKCGNPLSFEVGVSKFYWLSADGKMLIAALSGQGSDNISEALICPNCGVELEQGKHWLRNEKGRIVLVMDI